MPAALAGVVRGKPLVLDLRQDREEPIVEPGAQHGVGRDDVDPLDEGQAGEQVEVGGPEAVRVGGAIGHRDDDVPQRPCRRHVEQQAAQAVFVHRAGGRHPGLVAAEGGRQEPRLAEQAFGPAVGVRLRLEIESSSRSKLSTVRPWRRRSS